MIYPKVLVVVAALALMGWGCTDFVQPENGTATRATKATKTSTSSSGAEEEVSPEDDPSFEADAAADAGSASSSSGSPALDAGPTPISPSIHEGKLVGADGRPLALVNAGQRVQFEVLATASHFGSSLEHTHLTVTEFDAIPWGTDITKAQPVWGFPNRPAAFLAGGKLHPVSCLSAIGDNGSSIMNQGDDPYLKLKVGFTLTCTR
jgi:hypothetical protein